MTSQPNASAQLTQRGEMLLERHRPQEAEDQFRQALAANPNNADAHFGLARCLAQDSRRPHKALEEIERALALEPNWSGYHAFRAQILCHMGQLKQARTAVQGALELAPDFAYSWQCAALIEQAAGKWKAMEDAARKALELDPDDADNASLLAVALRLQHRHQEAEAILQGSLSNDPENAETHHQVGWQKLPVDQAQAETHFYEALRLNPQHEGARKGMLEAFKGRNWLYQTHRKMHHFFARILTVKRGLIVFFSLCVVAGILEKLPVSNSNGLLYFIREGITWSMGLAITALLLFGGIALLNYIIGNFMVLNDARARMALTSDEKTRAWFVLGLTAVIILYTLHALIVGPL